jgi:hypothetical protein
MDTPSAIVAVLKELGTPAITVIGFAWVIFKLNKLSSDVGELKTDMRSIKGNHLPHIEAAIKELSEGTPNEAHVKAILDLSHEADII